MQDPRLDLIKQLTPVAIKLIKQTVRKYENGAYASCFTEDVLQAEAEDLMLKMSQGVISGEIEEKGVYNYFSTAFKNKCKDRYHANARTKKRGGINLENKDLSDCTIKDGSLTHCPEDILALKQELEMVIKFLSTFDKPKIKYSLLIKDLLEGIHPSDIQKKLGLSASSLDRYKAQAIELLKEYPKNVMASDFYTSESDDPGDTMLYAGLEEAKVTKHYLSREIKFNPKMSFGATFRYICTVEVYQNNKLIQKRNLTLRESISHNKDEFLTLERTNIKEIELELQPLINSVAYELKSA